MPTSSQIDNNNPADQSSGDSKIILITIGLGIAAYALLILEHKLWGAAMTPSVYVIGFVSGFSMFEGVYFTRFFQTMWRKTGSFCWWGFNSLSIALHYLISGGILTALLAYNKLLVQTGTRYELDSPLNYMKAGWTGIQSFYDFMVHHPFHGLTLSLIPLGAYLLLRFTKKL